MYISRYYSQLGVILLQFEEWTAVADSAEDIGEFLRAVI